MSNATITFGNMNGPDASLRISVFILTRPYVTQLLGKVRKVTNTIPCAVTHSDTSGKLYVQTVEVMDGDVIMVQMRRTYNGRPFADGVIFAEIRETGPLYSILGKVIAVPNSLIGTAPVQALTATCDLLSFDEVRERGYRYPAHLDRIYGDPTELDILFDIRKIRDERATKPKLEKLVNSAGDTIAIVKHREPRRVIRIRR